MSEARALREIAMVLVRETGSITPAQLAARAGCLPESASNALRRMWRRGMLERSPAKRSGAPGAQGYVYREPRP